MGKRSRRVPPSTPRGSGGAGASARPPKRRRSVKEDMYTSSSDDDGNDSSAQDLGPDTETGPVDIVVVSDRENDAAPAELDAQAEAEATRQQSGSPKDNQAVRRSAESAAAPRKPTDQVQGAVDMTARVEVSEQVEAALSVEMYRLEQYLQPLDSERRLRERAVRDVTDAAQRLWPSCSVRVFGSSLTGLVLPDSDVDIVVLNAPPYGGLRQLSRTLLQRQLVLPRSLQMIEHARVPIVKFVHGSTNLQVDVSFNQGSGLTNGMHVQQYLERSPLLRPLLLLLKTYLRERGMNEAYTGGLGSYCQVLLVQTFLRHYHHVYGGPPLLELSASASVQEMRQFPPIGRVLAAFFDFYGYRFNYSRVCITRLLDFAPKGDLIDYSRPWALILQDPHAPDNDVGRSAHRVLDVRAYFQSASRAIRAMPDAVAARGGAGAADASGWTQLFPMLCRLLTFDTLPFERKRARNAVQAAGDSGLPQPRPAAPKAARPPGLSVVVDLDGDDSIGDAAVVPPRPDTPAPSRWADTPHSSDNGAASRSRRHDAARWRDRRSSRGPMRSGSSSNGGSGNGSGHGTRRYGSGRETGGAGRHGYSARSHRSAQLSDFIPSRVSSDASRRRYEPASAGDRPRYRR